MAVSAKEIIDSINRRHLPFKADYPPTPGDGNCFPHSILQQLKRPEFGGDYSELLATVDHGEFRLRVRNFIFASSSPAVQRMKDQFKACEGASTENGGRAVGLGMPWETYWSNIIKPNTWADHAFIQATAWYLEKDIRIISTTGER